MKLAPVAVMIVACIAAAPAASIAQEPIRPKVLVIYSEPGKHYRAEFDLPLEHLGWEADRVLTTDVEQQVLPHLDDYDMIVTATIWVAGADISSIAPAIADRVRAGGTLILYDMNHPTPLRPLLEALGESAVHGVRPGFYWDPDADPHRPTGFRVPPPVTIADHPITRAPMDMRPYLDEPGGRCWQSLGDLSDAWTPLTIYPDGHILMAGQEIGEGYVLSMSYYYAEGWARFQESFLRNAWALARFRAEDLRLERMDIERDGILLRVANDGAQAVDLRFDLTLRPPGGGEAVSATATLSVPADETVAKKVDADLSQTGEWSISARAAIDEDGEPRTFWTTENLAHAILPPLSMRVTKKYHYTAPVVSTLELSTPDGPLPPEMPAQAALRNEAGDEVECSLRAGGDAGDRVLEAGRLPEGRYRLSISAAGASVSDEIIVLGERRVMFDEHNRTVIDGELFFPIGIYFPAPSRWQEVRDTGFNSMYWLLPIGWGAEQEKVAETREEEFAILQDRAEETGLMNLVHLRTTWYEQWVQELAQSPSTLGWYIWDEPDYSTPGIENMSTWYDRLRALDPEHPVLLCSGGERYAPYCDMYMTSGYPGGKRPLSIVADMTEIARGLVHDEKPAWLALWAFGGYEGGPPLPTPRELRCITWLSAAHGIRGIWYYAYYTGRVGHDRTLEDYPELWAAFKPLLADLTANEDFLLAPESEPTLTVTTGDAAMAEHLHALERMVDGRPALLLVNDQEQPLQVTVTGAVVDGARDALGDAEISAAEGKVTLTLGDRAAALLRFGE